MLGIKQRITVQLLEAHGTEKCSCPILPIYTAESRMSPNTL
ncbi:unnamed protein product [Gulo gulo]|uniref:Uncharacterized protein n=1 Tax=Gulo gulo TaxID=48420 RepID=A0A9X9LFF2_GULGU|nr:unnamed protein product [Gulo gulo]